ncbi:heterokaryon incompatibility protein [Ophiostoma piceae UAMH 11346]|uniref:Heterokaryon incompatibility protein n=1 Tax=Ophiostoma piceae (strain UAMH 11346) TaxID=1262450 RepID=S3CGB2_OPHP1|nr:heterokaryon incompatibility protein [Ophiostoma piceae UAMH 11346]
MRFFTSLSLVFLFLKRQKHRDKSTTIEMPLTYKCLEDGEIRLLRLHLAEALDAPLHIDIFHANLGGDVPEYEALTYVWNEVWGHFPIWVDRGDTSNGKNTKEDVYISVTANLDAALRHVRYRTRSRVLWVDAICINQDDLAERSQQVRQMRRIYEMCTADVAWLGPTPLPPPEPITIDDVSDDDSDDVLDTAEQATKRAEKLEREISRRAGRRADRIRHQQSGLQEGLTLMRQIASRDSATLTDMIHNYHYSTTWPSIDVDEFRSQHPENEYSPEGPAQTPLLTNHQSFALRTTFSSTRLWQRVWIVQELSCAPKVFLAVGIDDEDKDDKEGREDRILTLDWDEELVGGFLDDHTYADAFHSSWGHGSIGPAAARIFARVRALHMQRKYARSHSFEGSHAVVDAPANKAFHSFLDILARFKWTSSTDPRDKVYGLLGLVSEETPFLLPVDYTKSAAEVYTDTTVAIIQAGGSLDLISQNPFYGSGILNDENPHRPTDGDDTDEGDNDGERVRNLPSWVPNFDHSQHWEYDDQFATILFAQRGIYTAGKPDCRHLFPLHMISGWTTSAKGKRRSVSGIKLRGSVIGRMDAFKQGPWEDNTTVHYDGRAPLNTLIKMRNLYVGESQSKIYSATGESLLDAFWRTMVADCAAYPIRRLDWAAEGAECRRALSEACSLRAEEQETEDDETRHFTTDEEWQNYRFSPGYEHFPPSAKLLSDTLVAEMLPRMMTRWGICEVVPSARANDDECSNLLAMVWPEAKKGDIVAALDGSKVPVVLRPQDIIVEVEAEAGRSRGTGCDKDAEWTSTAQYYIYICPAYVHGYMDGEALAQLAEGRLAEQDFVLI